MTMRVGRVNRRYCMMLIRHFINITALTCAALIISYTHCKTWCVYCTGSDRCHHVATKNMQEIPGLLTDKTRSTQTAQTSAEHGNTSIAERFLQGICSLCVDNVAVLPGSRSSSGTDSRIRIVMRIVTKM